jgi:hypothetical protein
MALLEELEDIGMPVPQHFPQDLEQQEFTYAERPELHNTIRQAKGGFMRKAKNGLTP